MSNFGQGGFGFSLKALLEDPNLQNPPSLHNAGRPDLKKAGKMGSYVQNPGSAFLGGNLWEKTGNQGGPEFDLEYMDLDEFLSENGIPVNLEETDEAQTMSLLATALTQSPVQSPGSQLSPGIPLSPPSPPRAHSLQERDKPGGHMAAGSLSVFMPSPVHEQSMSPINLGHLPLSSPNTPEPSAIEKCLLDDSFGIKFPLSDTESSLDSAPVTKATSTSSSTVKRKLSVVDELSVVTIPVYGHNGGTSPDSMVTSYTGAQPARSWSDSSLECPVDDHSPLIQNSFPGQDNFDPAARKFSEEELKPQPIIKKSKKVFVDEGAKDDKYWQRRKKNNVAAKRSRDARRVKENQIAMRAAFLEKEFDDMRMELAETKCENEALKKRLSKYEKV